MPRASRERGRRRRGAWSSIVVSTLLGLGPAPIAGAQASVPAREMTLADVARAAIESSRAVRDAELARSAAGYDLYVEEGRFVPTLLVGASAGRDAYRLEGLDSGAALEELDDDRADLRAALAWRAPTGASLAWTWNRSQLDRVETLRVAPDFADLHRSRLAAGRFLSELDGNGAVAVVGGAGIFNVMALAVGARKREIGVRRSLGARQSDIERHFLLESVLLAAAGGVLGLLAGVAATWALARLAGWSSQVSGTGIVLGLLVSVGLGVASGWLPARQAARLGPAAALRG